MRNLTANPKNWVKRRRINLHHNHNHPWKNLGLDDDRNHFNYITNL